MDTLRSHDIKPGETPPLPDVDIKFPELRGANLIEHFYEIANEQSQPYRKLVEAINETGLPPMPKTWKLTEGWTRYDDKGMATSVPYPEENALIFDTEVCMQEGSAATMACAVGQKHWYSWTSKALVNTKRSSKRSNEEDSPRIYSTQDMIPLESSDSTEPKIIIGHNVSFDRARIRNQYDLHTTPTRFLDTMSLHVCVSGITSFQRAMLKSSKEIEDDDLSWSSMSSLNSLLEVFKLYCGENHADMISKDKRSTFVSGSLNDIRKDFQNLMTYCAGDVLATYRVLQKLFPLFTERFPHPATLAGMLEIGMAYLPVNSNWVRYINESDLIYKDLNIESKYLLAKRANQACRLLHNEAYKRDLWLWDEDWSVQELKFNKISQKALDKLKSDSETNAKASANDEFERLEHKFRFLCEMKDFLPVRKPLLAGYPAWYRKLCTKPNDSDWQPGPNEIATGMQVAPKLLSLCWEGYPLHFIRGQGWGFLVPFTDNPSHSSDKNAIPLEQLVKKCPVNEGNAEASANESEYAFNNLAKEVEKVLSKKDYYSTKNNDPTGGKYNGTGIWCDMELEDCCWFFKLPHKNGINHRVGNPLARDFLIKFSENVLAGDNVTAERVIQIARMLSYWRNNRDRIISQMVVQTSGSEEENAATERKTTIDGEAAIVPQVIVCGTLTRRAVEPTWMTASNAQSERIGSELRSMVQAPDGYRIVGADVDSQELWIASVLGDASEAGIHGATPFGWMTLNGTKSNGTDMHSITAKAVGISRDHAKVLNYARIYGAGQMFATRLLKQFNPTISDGVAKSKATKMFTLTKGKKVYRFIRDESDEETFKQKDFSSFEAQQIAVKFGRRMREMFEKGKWSGGTESAMFNRLEEIAEMEHPVTPFLQVSFELDDFPLNLFRYLN